MMSLGLQNLDQGLVLALQVMIHLRCLAGWEQHRHPNRVRHMNLTPTISWQLSLAIPLVSRIPKSFHKSYNGGVAVTAPLTLTLGVL